ncbi:MAG: IS21 family transposase [Negativicutes bacterium]|nr:IS21 family transposase [Negativicutes bacterium]
MKELKMYSKIKQLEQKGFTERQTASILRISRKTVSKYRKMSLDDYMKRATSVRKLSSLEELKPVILDWLQSYPSMTAAQVHDWLLEHYRDIVVSQRTVSRYVRDLRFEYNIAKKAVPRCYEASDEVPMGYQLQLDFGVKNMPLADRQGHRKVYFVGMVLAHSRYKWGYFQTKPFTSGTLIQAMNYGFQYFGGIPKEIVVDQDSIIVVSENLGDIIYTYEFEQYKSQLALDIHVCRKADPESKGMVESTVKYIKGNFLPHRFFMEEDMLNEAFLAWLERTGNAKTHGTTKKVPAQVFELEREHLRAVQSKIYNLSPSIMRTVRKDNTILYNSSRYSLPLGTYIKHPQVTVTVKDGNLSIYDGFGDCLLASHPISLLPGKLVKSSDHRRDKSASLDRLEEEILELMKSPIAEQWQSYLMLIRERKPRYYRDQLTLLKQMLKTFSGEILEDAMLYCGIRELYSINDLRSAAEFMVQHEPVEDEDSDTMFPLNSHSVVKLNIQRRRISDYEFLGGGSHE